MTGRILRRALAIALVSAFVSAASATDFFVDPLDGSDANDGLTIAAAKKTIQQALNVTVDGDTVFLLPGEYSNAFSIARSNLSVIALGEAVVTGGPSVLGPGSNNLFRGITFKDCTSTALSAPGFFAVIEDCRFISNQTAIANTSNTQIRRCLFARNSVVAVVLASGSVLEHCTFYGNQRAIRGLSRDIVIRNNSFVSNEEVIQFDPSGSGGLEMDYNHLHLNTVFAVSPEPVTCVNCSSDDPLFIDPDNDVFAVRPGSPLLNQGEFGGPIGAFGRGFHTSKDLTKDEPFQSASPWDGWIDAAGVPLSSSSLVEINPDNEVILRDGQIEAPIYSPVFDTDSQYTVIRTVDFGVFEDTTLDDGLRQIIDYERTTPEREIRIRTKMVSFAQDAVGDPAWQVVAKHVRYETRAQYVQMELVLRRDGD